MYIRNELQIVLTLVIMLEKLHLVFEVVLLIVKTVPQMILMKKLQIIRKERTPSCNLILMYWMKS